MTEFFANSLMNGFVKSSLMGQGIVVVQLLASVFMVAIAIGKWRGLSSVSQAAGAICTFQEARLFSAMLFVLLV